MREVYLFGRISKIMSFLSFSFFIVLFINGMINDGVNLINLFYLLILLLFFLIDTYSLWSRGIFLSNNKKYVKFSLYLSKKKDVIIKTSDISRIDFEIERSLLEFVVVCKNGEIKIIHYRLLLREFVQYNKLKKGMYEFNKNFKN